MASGVEFDEDNMTFARPGVRPGMPSMGGRYAGSSERQERGIAGFLMRHGFAKTYGGAQVIMLGIVVVNIIIIFVVVKFFL